VPEREGRQVFRQVNPVCKSQVRNRLKSGLGNAPGVDLAGIAGSKQPTSAASVPSEATCRAPTGLFRLFYSQPVPLPAVGLGHFSNSHDLVLVVVLDLRPQFLK
jgi:hypothetical protein